MKKIVDTMEGLPGPDEVLTVCALRFDGYRYEKTSGIEKPEGCGAGLATLSRPVIDTSTLHADPLKNFAAFFVLQRFLFKWGGEYLTRYAPEHVAIDFLFLALYDRDVPEEFANADYVERWQREFVPDRERYAGFFRRSFRRKGRGPLIEPAFFEVVKRRAR